MSMQIANARGFGSRIPSGKLASMLRPGGSATKREGGGRHRLAAMALAIPTLASSLSLAACRGASEAPGPVELRTEEIVTNPTERSVQIGLVPAEDVELYATFAPLEAATEGDASQMTPLHVGAGKLAVLRLEGLAAGTRHRAQVHLRRPGENGFVARAPVHFRTLRADPGATVRFAYAADSHIVGRHIKGECERSPGSSARSNFQQTLENVLASDLDFVIAGGDNFMTHAPLLRGCPAYEAYGSGTVRTAAQADLRYELGLALWGRVPRELPFLYVLGNHDGEARFGDARGSYGHFSDTRALSRNARLRHLPDPTATYDGSRDGDLYYTFRSGSARFIVLDVMAGPTALPRRVDDWTLGAAQLRWLEAVLVANRSPWVFVFAEHLVGGVTHPDGRPFADEAGTPGEYHYGRGGLRSTVDGTTKGRFLGEQAALQALLRRHGADVFFHAHDHVAVIGEKRDPDGRGEGVYYAMAGQASGDADGPGWVAEPWFASQMDYDGDGRPDYAGANGTAAAGFYRVTVEGTKRVLLEFVRSDSPDAPVAFRWTIFPDGSSELSSAAPPENS
jgi:hypothetical protein